MSNDVLVPVPFHGNILFLVEQNNEPYTPMKPIVEGMGLDWASQFTKLKSDPKRWGSIVMTTIQVPGDTQGRETLCMPLRKLPGWLMTIQPSRVKPEIREKILQYQNECDDVLWEYWTRGRAENPRVIRQDPSATPTLNLKVPIDFRQHVQLRKLIDEKIRILPEPLHQSAYSLIMKALFAFLGIRSRKDLTQYRFEEACQFVKDYPLVRLPAVIPKTTEVDLDFPKKTARPSRSFWKDLPPDAPKDGLSVQDLLDPDYPDPLRQLLERIEKAGYDVQGPWIQYQAMKEHLRSAAKAFDEIHKLSRVRRMP
ncbi:phage antirepressor N-terminal domain-containing protein [Leptospirillum ferriphilum]|uniref:phage antirepressor N-terminal domain-containing protein n=1 Tax=Leptospirillum ferriphilum TaxID=178606 RepID=UPI0006B1BE5B|nr:phage antirepressor N-terminal domain-containing protein [Leptospirillum ferriphilum]